MVENGKIIPICFWCHRPFPEAAIPVETWEKAHGQNDPVPDDLVTTYVPCPRCRSRIQPWEVLVVEISDDRPKDGRPPISESGGKKLYLTGLAFTINKSVFADFAEKIGIPEKSWRDMIEQEGIMCLPRKLIEQIRDMAEPSNKNTKKKPRIE